MLYRYKIEIWIAVIVRSDPMFAESTVGIWSAAVFWGSRVGYAVESKTKTCNQDFAKGGGGASIKDYNFFVQKTFHLIDVLSKLVQPSVQQMEM